MKRRGHFPYTAFHVLDLLILIYEILRIVPECSGSKFDHAPGWMLLIPIILIPFSLTYSKSIKFVVVAAFVICNFHLWASVAIWAKTGHFGLFVASFFSCTAGTFLKYAYVTENQYVFSKREGEDEGGSKRKGVIPIEVENVGKEEQ